MYLCVPLPSHPHACSFLQNQTLTEFREWSKEDTPGFKLKLDRRMDYPMVAKHVAAHMQLENPEFLQFFHNVYVYVWRDVALLFGMPRSPLLTLSFPRRYFNHYENALPSNMSLDQMLRIGRSTIIYYEVLNSPLQEVETKTKMQDVSVLNHATFTCEPQNVLLDKHATIEELIEAVKPNIKLWEHGSGTFRALHITPWATEILRPDEDATSYERYTLRVEEIPKDQVEPLPEGHRVFNIYHMWKDLRHGHPFFFTAINGETVADLKKRVKEYLQVADKEWSSWKFGGAIGRRYIRPTDSEFGWCCDALSRCSLHPRTIPPSQRTWSSWPSCPTTSSFSLSTWTGRKSARASSWSRL